MKLKELKEVLYSRTGEIQQAIIYNLNENKDVEYGCSIEFAMVNYGEYEVKRINSCYENDMSCLLITI